ncbi:MAG: PduL/EutD family phosphate acyltransferase, partial [Oscillospiraceae bacterium]
MNKILVETSARHIHLTKEHLEILFGEGATLTHKKDLSQPGQYAAQERLTVVGTKKEIESVSILGPIRPETQVELSLTDARSIGIVAPIRDSGNIKGSGNCILVGPKGKVELKEGVIIAKRHIHMTPEDAKSYN